MLGKLSRQGSALAARWACMPVPAAPSCGEVRLVLLAPSRPGPQGPSLPDAAAELLVTPPGRSRFFRGPARRYDRLAVLHLNTARQKSWLESRDSCKMDFTYSCKMDSIYILP